MKHPIPIYKLINIKRKIFKHLLHKFFVVVVLVLVVVIIVNILYLIKSYLFSHLFVFFLLICFLLPPYNYIIIIHENLIIIKK